MSSINKLLITGGTGSFGNAVLNRFLNTEDYSEVRIFSRDEKKQDDMRHMYKSEKIKFINEFHHMYTLYLEINLLR